jgi:hypothetical protein
VYNSCIDSVYRYSGFESLPIKIDIIAWTSSGKRAIGDSSGNHGRLGDEITGTNADMAAGDAQWPSCIVMYARASILSISHCNIVQVKGKSPTSNAIVRYKQTKREQERESTSNSVTD